MSQGERRLLVLAGVFPPAGGGGALRALRLVKHLPALGWRPHVVAPRARSGWFADPALESQLAGVEVTRVGLPGGAPWLEGLRRRAKDWSDGAAARDVSPSSASAVSLGLAVDLLRRARDLAWIPDEHLGWSSVAAVRAMRLHRARPFDLLLSLSFPYSAHLAGLAVARATGLPWIADFADPWVGHWHRSLNGALRRRLDGALEAAVVHGAAAVTVASPGMQRLLGERYGTALPPVRVWYNGFDAPSPPLAGPPVERSHLELIFVGTFDAKLTPPRPFVEALRLLAERSPQQLAGLRLRVLGGADLESARYLRQHLGGELRSVVALEGYVSHERALEAMGRADGLLLSVAPGAHWHLTAKVFEYLASGRPILAAVPEGDCRTLLERTGNAVLVDPQDPGALATLLEAAIARRRLEPARPLEQAALAELEGRHIGRAVAELAAAVLADHRARVSSA